MRWREFTMKKFLLSLIVLVMIAIMASCSKEELILTFEDISENTILVKSDGLIQAAIVEEFDKDYYSLSELTEFIKKEVNAYNQEVGQEEVVIDDVLLKGGKAVVILSYSGMAHYSGFNNVRAAYFRSDIEKIPLQLPEKVVNIKKDELVSFDSALDGKNQVLVLYEPYEVIVEGDIKYYSENATIEGDNKARSMGNDPTVIIYKH